MGTPERALQAIERVVQLMPEAEYARYRYQNRLHYVRAELSLAREEVAAPWRQPTRVLLKQRRIGHPSTRCGDTWSRVAHWHG